MQKIRYSSADESAVKVTSGCHLHLGSFGYEEPLG
jgi:hypothetical protein